jgi:hypothetical protein
MLLAAVPASRALSADEKSQFAGNRPTFPVSPKQKAAAGVAW